MPNKQALTNMAFIQTYYKPKKSTTPALKMDTTIDKS
jgi:hypothetical protein